MTSHTVFVVFVDTAAVITLFGPEEMAGDDRKTPPLQISCDPLDWKLAAVAEVLISLLSFLPTLETLGIAIYRPDWQDEIEVLQWREFLRPFTSVKEISLQSKDSVQLVAPALQELAGERSTEVLPALQKLLLGAYGSWQLSKPVQKVIEQFIAI